MTRQRAANAGPRQDPNTGLWEFIVDAGAGLNAKGNWRERRQIRRGGFKTKRAAQEEMDKVRRSITTATFVPLSTQTFGEYLDEWLAGLPTRLRPSTCDGYRRNLLYLPAALRSKRLDRVTAADLDRLYADLLKTGLRRRTGGLSPRSVRYLHVTVSKALSDAVDRDILQRNVATKAKPPRAKDTKPPEVAWWIPSQLGKFLALTADEPLGPLFRLAGLSGMRRGEVCGLQWGDLDLDRGELEVKHQLLVVRSPGAPNGGLLHSSVTKTDHGRRKISLDAETVAALKLQKSRQAGQRLALGAGWQGHENDLVFTQADGRPWDPESVAKRFDRRVARSGLPRIRFHDLRHSHAAALIAAGDVSLLAITRRMGHASISITQDLYGHLLPEADSQAAASAAALVDGLGG